MCVLRVPLSSRYTTVFKLLSFYLSLNIKSKNFPKKVRISYVFVWIYWSKWPGFLWLNYSNMAIAYCRRPLETNLIRMHLIIHYVFDRLLLKLYVIRFVSIKKEEDSMLNSFYHEFRSDWTFCHSYTSSYLTFWWGKCVLSLTFWKSLN